MNLTFRKIVGYFSSFVFFLVDIFLILLTPFAKISFDTNSFFKVNLWGGWRVEEIDFERTILDKGMAADIGTSSNAIASIILVVFALVILLFGTNFIWSKMNNEKLQLSPEEFTKRETRFTRLGIILSTIGSIFGILGMIFFVLFKLSINQSYAPASEFHFTFSFYFSFVLFAYSLLVAIIALIWHLKDISKNKKNLENLEIIEKDTNIKSNI